MWLLNPFTGKFDFTHDRTSLGLATTDSPVFSTVKLSGLTDGYIPKHTSDAVGLADSLLFQNASGIGIGVTPAVKFHLGGLSASADIIRCDIGMDFNPVVAPGALTLQATSGAGLEIGTYYYWVAYGTALGYTNLGTRTSVVTSAGNQRVTVTLPVSTDYRVTSRRVYRAQVGVSNSAFLVATIANNTETSYIDSTPDASLPTTDVYYQANTTCKYITSLLSGAMVVDKYLTSLGAGAGAAITSAGKCTLLGASAGNSITTGMGNALVGDSAGLKITIGTYNVALGADAIGAVVSGVRNVSIGVNSGVSSTGSRNTLLGFGTGYVCGSDNVMLGYYAGRYETGSSKLFIDNVTRSNEADGRAKALVYGIFASTTAAQYFTVNGHLVALEDLTAPHVLCHEIKTDTTTATDLTITCGTDKTLVLTETVWDDFPPDPIISARLGSSAPTLATFQGNIEQYTFDATNDYVIGSTEIPHGWKEGTAIIPHIHWATNGVDSTARGVKWQLEYSVGDFNETFSSASQITVDATIGASTADRTHYVSNFTTNIDGTNLKIGAYIVWRLNRIATAHANGAPTADPFALAIGFHGEFDTLGSRGTTSK